MGFSTVIGHLVAGEERFSVEWREDDSSVWLDLYSVSTGKGVLGKVGPCLRCIACTVGEAVSPPRPLPPGYLFLAKPIFTVGVYTTSLSDGV